MIRSGDSLYFLMTCDASSFTNIFAALSHSGVPNEQEGGKIFPAFRDFPGSFMLGSQ